MADFIVCYEPQGRGVSASDFHNLLNGICAREPINKTAWAVRWSEGAGSLYKAVAAKLGPNPYLFVAELGGDRTWGALYAQTETSYDVLGRPESPR